MRLIIDTCLADADSHCCQICRHYAAATAIDINIVMLRQMLLVIDTLQLAYAFATLRRPRHYAALL